MTERNKGGRPKFKVTPEKKKMIEQMSSMGIPQEQIAAIVGCSVDTLAKYFNEDMMVGKGKANFEVAKSLFNNAKKGNVTAQVFWLKTQARWKETTQLELTGKNDGPVEISDAKARLLAGITLPNKE